MAESYVPEFLLRIKSELWTIGDGVRRTFILTLGHSPRDYASPIYRPYIRILATPDHGKADSVLRTLETLPQERLAALYSQAAESGRDLPL